MKKSSQEEGGQLGGHLVSLAQPITIHTMYQQTKNRNKTLLERSFQGYEESWSSVLRRATQCRCGMRAGSMDVVIRLELICRDDKVCMDNDVDVQNSSALFCPCRVPPGGDVQKDGAYNRQVMVLRCEEGWP